jgi:hypothetical protein
VNSTLNPGETVKALHDIKQQRSTTYAQSWNGAAAAAMVGEPFFFV